MRPAIKRRDFNDVLRLLNEREGSREGTWQADNREMSSAVKFVNDELHLTPSTLKPDEVAEAFSQSSSKAVGSAS